MPPGVEDLGWSPLKRNGEKASSVLEKSIIQDQLDAMRSVSCWVHRKSHVHSVAVLSNDLWVEAIITAGSCRLSSTGNGRWGYRVLGGQIGLSWMWMWQPCLYMVKWQVNTLLWISRYFRSPEIKSSGRRRGNHTCRLDYNRDSFIASEEKNAIREHSRSLGKVEMKVAIACRMQLTSLMVIRAMSDTADHAANISFDEFIVEAGERSAQTPITFLIA